MVDADAEEAKNKFTGENKNKAVFQDVHLVYLSWQDILAGTRSGSDDVALRGNDGGRSEITLKEKKDFVSLKAFPLTIPGSEQGGVVGHFVKDCGRGNADDSWRKYT